MHPYKDQYYSLSAHKLNSFTKFVYTTTSKNGSQLLLTPKGSNGLLGRGSEKAFNVFPSAA